MPISRLLAVALIVAGTAAEFPGTRAQTRRPESTAAAEIRRIHEEAIAAPFDAGKFAAYLKTLGRADAYYVVEGDLRMTEDEVRLYLVSQSQRATPADGAATELLVNLHGGRRDFYPIGRRRLTYAIDRASFSDLAIYQKVVKEMQEASLDWEKACANCGVDFDHVPAVDASPSPEKVSFVVRMRETPYAALAFFPHDPPEKRYLDLNPLYLTAGYDSVGVLRHELGHTLGYRHEHAPGIAACIAEENQRFERLTEYDSESVMHYICSQTTGSSELLLTGQDRSGHQRLYGVSTGTESAPHALRPQPPPGGAALVSAYAAAVAHPMDAGARAGFAALLPKHGQYYVLEGDLRVTESELAAYIASASGGTRFGAPTSELLVNTYRGNRDFYPPSDRRLNYVVDRASFLSDLQYRRMVEDLEDATASWESACPSCGIAFTHLQRNDAGPDGPTGASFIVRRVAAGGAFVASAFFPHTEPARRILEVDQSFFGSKKTSRLGVLRHQIGHILGYRHGDVGGVAGCTRVGNDWVPVAFVPADSVMRYICGPEDSDVELMEGDIKSHRRLYGPLTGSSALPPPPPPPGGSPGVLVVRFEGGEVGFNAAKVMEALYGKGVLPIGTHTVTEDEITETLFAGHLQLPPSLELKALAKQLNPKKNVDNLHRGDVLRMPQVTFVPGWFYLTFDAIRDAARIDEIKKKWAHLEPREARSTPGGPGSQSQTAAAERGSVRIGFRRYELRLPIQDAALLDGLAEAINDLDSKNIVVSISKPAASPSGPRFFAQFSWHHSKELMLKPEGEGSLGAIVGMPAELKQPQCDPSCPEIVVIDSPVRLHPDVIGAIASGGEHDDPPATPRPYLLDGTGRPANVAASATGLSHGTYMAGLIGSRVNSFGLIGINPWTRIHSLNSDMLQPTYHDPTALVDAIDERQNSAGGIQVYVIASDYPVPPRATPAARINDDSFAKKVRQEAQDLLLVAAAGQPPDEGGAALDVNQATLRGPANLGDQPNVIVVTACQQCTDPNGARLMSDVNFSTTGFVHLAAPGDRIPGPVIGGKYAEGSKTSPATALVAGVASLMAATFPARYRSPGVLKRRLLVTSSVGSMLAENGMHRIAGGFLDPEAALRDPSFHYVQKFGETACPVSSFQWQVSQIQTFDPSTNSRYTVELSRVVRLIHRGSQIVVFEAAKERIEGYPDPVSIVRRVGPLTVGTAIRAQPLVSYSRTVGNKPETTELTLEDTTDVLLASVVPPGVR